MANSSLSSSILSYSEPFTEEQEMAIYKSIKMVRLRKTFERCGKYNIRPRDLHLLLNRDVLNLLQNLQDIQKAMHDINMKIKNIQGEMCITAALVNAIESEAPAIEQD